MDEQLIIDILYFIFHDVFQWLAVVFYDSYADADSQIQQGVHHPCSVCCRIQSTCLSAS